MKKEYKRYILIFLFIFFLSFYITSVYQNYQEKQDFERWQNSFLKNQSREISEQNKEGDNEIFYIEKMNAISEYSNKILFYEIKDTTSKDIFSLIPFRSKNLSIKKWNYTDEIIYCIIEGSKNNWINLHGYISSFENESNIETEDWDEEVWGEFLKFLDTKLPDYEDIQKEYRFTEKKIEINIDTKALKNFHDRTLEGYKTKMKNGETDKVLFDLEVLKSFEVLVKNGGKLPYFSERDYSISRKEYVTLIKQNLKCSVPMALWIWVVYIIITYTMTRRQML